MTEAEEEFLSQCGAHKYRHGCRTLYEHLRATELILRNWDCCKHVCSAGLLHSIYGTNAFKKSAVKIENRLKVTDIIGAEAEELVYLFHLCDRPRAFTDGVASGCLVDRFTGQKIDVAIDTLACLIEIECANLVDQGRGDRFFVELNRLISTSKLSLTPAVVVAIDTLQVTDLNAIVSHP